MRELSTIARRAKRHFAEHLPIDTSAKRAQSCAESETTEIITKRAIRDDSADYDIDFL